MCSSAYWTTKTPVHSHGGLSDCDIEDFTELENHRIWSRIPLDGGTRFSGALKLKTFAPYPNIRDEDKAEEIITESLERFAAPPLTDDEMMRAAQVWWDERSRHARESER